MKGFKKIELANFNCTFGNKNEPMMNYFDEIIYPAFKSKRRRENRKSGDKYFFENVQLIKIDDTNFVLTGLLIRRTQLEVKSMYEEGKGIKDTDLVYDSDPYSVFSIFLKNHRMIYIKNQKGSPDIRSFGSTAREIINSYVSSKNICEKKEDKLPMANLNVVNIPSSKTIKEEFEEIEKIKKVTFRLYPLNGDVEVGNIFKGFREELKNVGSKSGNMNINTPEEKEEVSKLIDDVGDTADTTIRTILKNGNIKTFRNNNFKEQIPIVLPEGNSILDNIKYAIKKVESRNEIKNVSEKNKKIFLDNLRKVFKIYEQNN